MKVRVKVEGLKQFDASLGELSKGAARGVLRRVLRKAGQPMADMASALAPDDPETGAPDLHTSIIVSDRVRNTVGNKEFSDVLASGGSTGEAVAAMRDARRAAKGEGSFAEVFVGPAAGSKRAAIKAIAQEFGSVNHPPHPYMRPAWDAKSGEALDTITREMGGEIDKAAARAARRAARIARGGK
ncbi:MAG: HK97 gp10 family phage protein [Hyphomicrobiales bacterium]|nr:MAG: HK97 gp10 family phage protein [Hyphomicrobiales bacterium]